MKVYNEHLKNYSDTKDKIMHTCKMIERLLFEEKQLIFISLLFPNKKISR